MSSNVSISDIFRLDDKIAVVTGGCGNLGPYWTIALIEAGADVAIIDLPSMKLPVILKKYSQKQLKAYSGDITNLTNLKTIHEQIKRDFGKVGILVNNAGIDAPPVINDVDINVIKRNDLFEKMWEVNVQGMVNCIEEFYPDMEKKRRGSIINIGSLYGERSSYEGLYTHLDFDKPWIYGATKAALHNVTMHYATRLAKYGVRVNTLSPGGLYNNQDKEFVRKFSERVHLGRMAQKETDLNGPLVFLASDASSYVTGINLEVNGGYTAW